MYSCTPTRSCTHWCTHTQKKHTYTLPHTDSTPTYTQACTHTAARGLNTHLHTSVYTHCRTRTQHLPTHKRVHTLLHTDSTPTYTEACTHTAAHGLNTHLYTGARTHARTHTSVSGGGYPPETGISGPLGWSIACSVLCSQGKRGEKGVGGNSHKKLSLVKYPLNVHMTHNIFFRVSLWENLSWRSSCTHTFVWKSLFW